MKKVLLTSAVALAAFGAVQSVSATSADSFGGYKSLSSTSQLLFIMRQPTSTFL